MSCFIVVLEIIGTISFAVSGAVLALSKNMDLFGMCMLGITTACGGGMIRDLLLGITPPTVLENPMYLTIAGITSVVIFLPFVRKFISSNKKIYDLIMTVTDSLGLGIFTVCGVKVAIDSVGAENSFLIVFVAVITGVGGGVLRDMFAGMKPYIFVKHFYACASIIGAVICTFGYNITGEKISLISGFIVIVVIRLCASKFRWSLPKADSMDV